jgi:hypothetical protein
MPEAPSSRAGWRGPACAILLCLVCVVAGRPTLQADLLADDFGYLQLFGRLSLGEALAPGDFSRGIWGHTLDEMRPVFALFFWASTAVFGADPVAHHALNVALHAGCTLLVFAMASVLAGGRSATALLAGLLFALAPAHSEPVAWITGRTDLLPTALLLLSWLAFLAFRLRGGGLRYGLSLAAFAAGMFTKEILVTLPVLLAALEVHLRRSTLHRPRPPASAWAHVRLYLPYLAIAASAFVLRRIAFGSFAREDRLRPGLVLAFLARQGRALRLLLLADGGYWASGIVLGLLLCWSLVLIRERTAYREAVALVVLFGVVWYGVTLVPLVVTYASARHLYLPSCGIALGLAFLILPISNGRTRITLPRLATAALLVMLSAHGLSRRLEGWVDAGRVSRTLRAEVLRLAPQVPPGSVVVLSGIPAHNGTAFVWQWALPYALERPFLPVDLIHRFHVLEPLEVYCCPAPAWWEQNQAAVDRLRQGPPEEAVEIVSLHWSPEAGALVARSRRVPRTEVRGAVDGAVGISGEAMDEGAVARLLGALSDLARPASTR